MFDLPGVPGCSEQDSGDLAVVVSFSLSTSARANLSCSQLGI